MVFSLRRTLEGAEPVSFGRIIRDDAGVGVSLFLGTPSFAHVTGVTMTQVACTDISADSVQALFRFQAGVAAYTTVSRVDIQVDAMIAPPIGVVAHCESRIMAVVTVAFAPETHSFVGAIVTTDSAVIRIRVRVHTLAVAVREACGAPARSTLASEAILPVAGVSTLAAVVVVGSSVYAHPVTIRQPQLRAIRMSGALSSQAVLAVRALIAAPATVVWISIGVQALSPTAREASGA
jgi:hypothetical protein